MSARLVEADSSGQRPARVEEAEPKLAVGRASGLAGARLLAPKELEDMLNPSSCGMVGVVDSDGVVRDGAQFERLDVWSP